MLQGPVSDVICMPYSTLNFLSSIINSSMWMYRSRTSWRSNCTFNLNWDMRLSHPVQAVHRGRPALEDSTERSSLALLPRREAAFTGPPLISHPPSLHGLEWRLLGLFLQRGWRGAWHLLPWSWAEMRTRCHWMVAGAGRRRTAVPQNGGVEVEGMVTCNISYRRWEN